MKEISEKKKMERDNETMRQRKSCGDRNEWQTKESEEKCFLTEYIYLISEHAKEQEKESKEIL